MNSFVLLIVAILLCIGVIDIGVIDGNHLDQIVGSGVAHDCSETTSGIACGKKKWEPM